MNKEQRRTYFVKKFMFSDCTSVMNYYVKPSDTKVAIEQGIKEQMLERNGKRYRILGGSSFHFTCAYVYPKEDKWILVVETYGNHHEFDLTDKEVQTACLEIDEYKMLNYLVQSQAAEKYCKHKHDTDASNINIAELSKLAVKEHKDMHKLVASKIFGIKYEAVTEEQRCIAKTVDFEYLCLLCQTKKLKTKTKAEWKKDMCPKCINSDGDCHCITKEEAPFGTFICENGEMFEPLVGE